MVSVNAISQRSCFLFRDGFFFFFFIVAHRQCLRGTFDRKLHDSMIVCETQSPKVDGFYMWVEK